MEKKDKQKKRFKILIVDDEMFIREIYNDAFEARGYDAEVAVDGIDAINRMDKESYDVILLDIMMPNMDGVNMLANIKEKPPKNQQGPIVITTNLEPDSLDSLQSLYAKYGDKPEELGVVGHVVKVNVEPMELVETVDEILE